MENKLPIPTAEAERIIAAEVAVQRERERLLLAERAKARKARNARLQRLGKHIKRITLNHDIGVLIPYNNSRSEKMIKAEKKKVVAALAEGLTVHHVVLEYHGLSPHDERSTKA